MIKKAFQHPGNSILHLAFGALRGYWWKRYAKLARHQGLNDLFLVLSFDCDTDQDAQATKKLHPQLVNLGIKPIYAVPGQILEDNEKIFQSIYDKEGQFINHGYHRHTYYDDKQGEFQSCFFYDKLATEKIEEDIRLGHQALKDVLGANAVGFRTPHFGTFQGKKYLKFLYAILEQLGYRFSTSTIPLVAFLKGPVYKPNGFEGITEFPVSGRFGWPLSILDSWRHWNGTEQRMDFKAYQRELLTLVRFFMDSGPGLLNVYVDPFHVAVSELFVDTMIECIRIGAKPADYQKLLGLNGTKMTK